MPGSRLKKFEHSNISAERCYIKNLAFTFTAMSCNWDSYLYVYSSKSRCLSSGLCSCFTSFLSETSVFIVNLFHLIVWWHSLVTYGQRIAMNGTQISGKYSCQTIGLHDNYCCTTSHATHVHSHAVLCWSIAHDRLPGRVHLVKTKFSKPNAFLQRNLPCKILLTRQCSDCSAHRLASFYYCSQANVSKWSCVLHI